MKLEQIYFIRPIPSPLATLTGVGQAGRGRSATASVPSSHMGGRGEREGPKHVPHPLLSFGFLMDLGNLSIPPDLLGRFLNKLPHLNMGKINYLVLVMRF